MATSNERIARIAYFQRLAEGDYATAEHSSPEPRMVCITRSIAASNLALFKFRLAKIDSDG